MVRDEGNGNGKVGRKAIERALDRAQRGLERLDRLHEIGSTATGHERLAQAAESSALLSSVWSVPPAERLLYRDGSVTGRAPALAGRSWTLADIRGDETPGFHGDKDAGKRFVAISSTEIARYQQLLYANGTRGDRRRLLIVLQGMDASGKGGIVKHVFRQGDPMGIRYHGFGRPTPEEAAHDFLWRVRRALPGPGWIGVFDRSHYEDVVMPQVWDAAPEALWCERCERINDFEAELAADGCAIIKIFLVGSRERQREHFLARLDDPTKRWKFDPSDMDARERWDDYMAAWSRVFALTSTPAAPWHLVPADNRWYSRAVVSELLRTTLAGFNMQWPPLASDVDPDDIRRRLAEA